MRHSSIQRVLAFVLSFSICLSTTVNAAPPPPIDQPGQPLLPGDFSQELTAADDFHRNYADLEKVGEGQPRSSLAADRFLMWEQTVFPKEVPVVKTFVGHTYRKWRLNTLLKKTDKYLKALPEQTSPLVFEDTVARTKAWFKNYAYLESSKREGAPLIETARVMPEIAAISDPAVLSAEVFKQIRELLTPEQRQAVGEIPDGEARLKKLNEIMIREAILDHITNGRRADTPLFLWDRQKDKAELESIKLVLANFQNQWQWNDRNGVLNVTDAPTERQNRAVNWWDTSVQIQEGDRVVKSLHMSDTADGRSTSGEQPYFCSATGCRFNITKGNQVLHVFGIQSQVVSTFDQFVVFTHMDSYDQATGTQYLHFLDMGSYNGVIGNEEIPVFRLPLKIDEPIQSLTMKNGRLVINGKFFVEKKMFEDASDWQQVAFNLQANLTNPDSWAKVLPLVDSVQELFSKSIRTELKSKTDEAEGLREATVLMPQLAKELQGTLNTQKLMKPLTRDEHRKLGDKIAQNSPTAMEAVERLELYHKRVSQSAILAKIMNQTQERSRVSRQLGARVRLLGSTLVSPRPFASQRIKEALGAWYVGHADKDGKRPTSQKLMDRVLALTDRPYINAGVIAAGILAATSPESFNTMVQAGLSVSTAILDYTVGMIHGIGGAGVEGTRATFAGISHPLGTLSDQYVANGAWWRTAIGMTAFIGVLGGLYFIPHFIFNYKQLKKDLGGSIWKKGGVDAFIARQENFRKAYFQRLADDEGKHRNLGEEISFSADEEKEIRAFLAQRYEEMGQRRFFGLLGGKQDVKDTITAAGESQAENLAAAMDAASQSTAIAKAENDSEEELKGFWQAAKQFAFSMPALELTLENWASKWNTWAGWRFTTVGFGYVNILGSDIPLYLKVKPISFAARVLYPEFLQRAVYSRKGRVVIPTETNGGLRLRCSRLYQKACGLLGFNSSPNNVDPKVQLEALKKFENQIIDVEEQINEVAFRQALENLPKFMQNKEDLTKLFNSKSLDSITQKDVLALSWESKTFLRAHYESIYKAAMVKYLGETLNERATQPDASAESAEVPAPKLDVTPMEPQTSIASDVDPEQENAQRTLKALKSGLVALQAPRGEQADYTFDLEKAKAAALAVADDPIHYQNAEAAVKKGKLSPSNFGMNARYNLASDMDPRQNRSMARLEVVNERLQRPGALGRALRSEISKLKLTLWIDLTFKLILSAGITAGSMKPIQETMFGDNSIFYLSATSFYMMMASGFFMSIMADAWLKLQQDARQDDMGEFGHIPQGEDAERSFVSWYRKQFGAKENSLLKNWAFGNSLAFWNLPAALTNITLFYFMFSGRIDLSLLVGGYALTFTTPVSAIHYKVEQAFERAAHYAARGVKDEKWLAHPEVQQLLVPEMQRLRDRFTFFNDIYGNVQNNWLGNIEMVPTSLGPRGFQRALFGGGLLEEYIVNHGLTPLKSAVAGIPVLDHVITPIANACETLLTFKNGDLRLPGK